MFLSTQKTVHAPVPASPPTTTTTSPAESRPMLSPTIRKALEGIPSLLRLQEMNNDRNKGKIELLLPNRFHGHSSPNV